LHGALLVEGMRDDGIGREQVFRVFKLHHMRRIAVGAIGGNLFGRQDEFRAAAVAMKGLFLQGFAVSLHGRHRNDEILFHFGVCACAQGMSARAILTDERTAVGREGHASAALGAHETVGIGTAQSIGRGGQAVGVDHIIRFELAVQDRQRTPRAGVMQVMRKAILQRLAFFGGIVEHFAHPKPCLGKHIMRTRHVNGAVQIAAGGMPFSPAFASIIPLRKSSFE
jgi:hypothetical protein